MTRELHVHLVDAIGSKYFDHGVQLAKVHHYQAVAELRYQRHARQPAQKQFLQTFHDYKYSRSRSDDSCGWPRWRKVRKKIMATI
jgi:hypothetical protein